MNEDETIDQETDGEPWKNEAFLQELYQRRGWSMGKIAAEMDCSSGTIDYWIKEFDIETRDLPDAMVGTGTVNYASFRTTRDGYEVWSAYIRGDGIRTVRVHRLLGVAVFGFEAVAGRVVHHNNTIRWDNRPENIAPMGEDEHGVHHHSKWADRTAHDGGA